MSDFPDLNAAWDAPIEPPPRVKPASSFSALPPPRRKLELKEQVKSVDPEYYVPPPRSSSSSFIPTKQEQNEALQEQTARAFERLRPARSPEETSMVIEKPPSERGGKDEEGAPPPKTRKRAAEPILEESVVPTVTRDSRADIDKANSEMKRVTDQLADLSRKDAERGYEVQKTREELNQLWGGVQSYRISMMNAFPEDFQDSRKKWTLQVVYKGVTRRLPMEFDKSTQKWMLRTSEGDIPVPLNALDLAGDRDSAQLNSALSLIGTIISNTKNDLTEANTQIDALKRDIGVLKAEKTTLKERSAGLGDDLNKRIAGAERAQREAVDALQRQTALYDQLRRDTDAKFRLGQGQIDERDKIIGDQKQETERIIAVANTAAESRDAEIARLTDLLAKQKKLTDTLNDFGERGAERDREEIDRLVRLLADRDAKILQYEDRINRMQKLAEETATRNTADTAGYLGQLRQELVSRDNKIKELTDQIGAMAQDLASARSEITAIRSQLTSAANDLSAQKTAAIVAESRARQALLDFQQRSAEEKANQDAFIRRQQDDIERLTDAMEIEQKALVASSGGGGPPDRPPEDKKGPDERDSTIADLRLRIIAVTRAATDAALARDNRAAELAARNAELEKAVDFLKRQIVQETETSQQLQTLIAQLQQRLAEDEARGGNVSSDETRLAEELTQARRETGRLRAEDTAIRSAQVVLNQTIASLRADNANLKTQLAEAQRLIGDIPLPPLDQGPREYKKITRKGYHSASRDIIQLAFLGIP